MNLANRAEKPQHFGKQITVCADNAVKPYNEGFNCPVCFDFVKEPVLASCCEQLFCRACVQMLPINRCPQCRTEPLRLAQRIIRPLTEAINRTHFECVYCFKQFTFDGRLNHEEECRMLNVGCPNRGCKQAGLNSP